MLTEKQRTIYRERHEAHVREGQPTLEQSNADVRRLMQDGVSLERLRRRAAENFAEKLKGKIWTQNCGG